MEDMKTLRNKLRKLEHLGNEEGMKIKYLPKSHRKILEIHHRFIGPNDDIRFAYYFGKAQDLYLTDDVDSPLYDQYVLVDYYNDILPLATEINMSYKQVFLSSSLIIGSHSEVAHVTEVFKNIDGFMTDNYHGQTYAFKINNFDQLYSVLRYTMGTVRYLLMRFGTKPSVLIDYLDKKLEGKLVYKPNNTKTNPYDAQRFKFADSVSYLNDHRDNIFYQFSESIYELADYLKYQSQMQYHRFVLDKKTLSQNCLNAIEKHSLKDIRIVKDYRPWNLDNQLTGFKVKDRKGELHDAYMHVEHLPFPGIAQNRFADFFADDFNMEFGKPLLAMSIRVPSVHANAYNPYQEIYNVYFMDVLSTANYKNSPFIISAESFNEYFLVDKDDVVRCKNALLNVYKKFKK